MIDSTYSVSSFEGLVSSKRRLHLPPNSRARPKFRLMDLACPTCRYPLGSGGKRVCTRPWYLLIFKSSRMRSRMKLEGALSASLGVLIGFVSRMRRGGQHLNGLLDPLEAGFAAQGNQRFK